MKNALHELEISLINSVNVILKTVICRKSVFVSKSERLFLNCFLMIVVSTFVYQRSNFDTRQKHEIYKKNYNKLKVQLQHSTAV